MATSLHDLNNAWRCIKVCSREAGFEAWTWNDHQQLSSGGRAVLWSKQQLGIFQPPTAAAALSKQLQILAAATNQLAKKIQLPTRKISSVCSWARASSIMAYSGPVIDVRVSRIIFSFRSIHHFLIQLKVTELNRVESSTLPKQLLRQIIFYWRIQDCFIEQNNFSTMFLRCSKSTFSITLAWWLQCSEEKLLFLANRKFTCPVWTGRERWHGLLSGDLLWGQHLFQNLFGRLSNSALDLMI